jgi:predicted PurR-regulated permease PerM
MSSSEHPFENPTSQLTTRQVIIGTLVVLSIILLFVFLYYFRTLVMLVFIGIVISISMSPVVDLLHQRKLPRSISVILIYFGLFILFFGFILLVIPQMIHQVIILAPSIESVYTDAKAVLQSSPFSLIHQLASNLPISLNSIFMNTPPVTGETVLASINWTFNTASSIVSGLFTIALILLLGFYWTLEGERMEYAFSLLLPVEKRESTRAVIQEVKDRMGGFVRGQGLLALTICIASFIAYSLMGLPSVLSLAVLAGAFELIPFFGPALGAIPALLVAFADDPTKILWVILATLLIQQLENHFLAPRIMQKTVGVNPIVTILSIIGFGSMFGFPGLLMAIPLAAVAQVVLNRLVLHPDGPIVKVPVGRDRVSQLNFEVEEFVKDIHALIRRKEAGAADEKSDEIEDAIESIATDLEGLLAQTVQVDTSS